LSGSGDWLRYPAGLDGTVIVGIDCATQESKTGLALALLSRNTLIVKEAALASSGSRATKTVEVWVRNAERVLLALDAPLGWPVPLARALRDHRAGEALMAAPNEMFRRRTDRRIQERLGKLPLDVGADRIARTAHAALRLLADVRAACARPLPLLWSPEEFRDAGVIEVYPAATRISLGIPRSRGSLAGLDGRLLYRGCQEPESEHARDAVVCAIAGVEFLQGRCAAPNTDELALAQFEGWIWAGQAHGDRGKTGYESPVSANE